MLLLTLNRMENNNCNVFPNALFSKLVPSMPYCRNASLPQSLHAFPPFSPLLNKDSRYKSATQECIIYILLSWPKKVISLFIVCTLWRL